ncbi:unnamed protein product [Allacma fusca]|uniref:Reverse transcriptase domain-containing protein n=1 Tax=Allacma fusca TaxID=39272 RepID=A0A8J2JT64_9HEXA|nr:unnamed protein product [Allacma fusca]
MIQDILSNCKNPSQFWRTIRSFRTNSNCGNAVKLSDWENFYQSALPHRTPNSSQQIFTNIVSELDALFAINELKDSLSSLSIGKSPGPDYIPNVLLKNLPDNMLSALLEIFNKALLSGNSPVVWSAIEMVMIFKKGERELPINYRGIALINTITKLFTSMLCRRITSWAESNNKLPESQAGFRKGRGCLNQIFTRMAVIQIKLRTKGGKRFALFVDFQRAFDSIPHDKLWEKLHLLGLSARVLNILRSIYDKAKMKVRTPDGYTKYFEVTQGVLQGDILSPLLFALYISDLDLYMIEQGCNTVGLGGYNSLVNLLLADDTVVLSESKLSLQHKIDVLSTYCKINDLTINLSKTKIIVFRKSGPLCKSLKWYLDNKLIEIVKSYTCLGIVFSSSGRFYEAMADRMGKARAALSNVLELEQKCSTYSYNGRCKIFDSICVSTLVYAC